MSFKNRRNDDEVKTAIKEWMDDRFAAFGKWTATGLAVAALGVLVWLMIQMNGVPWAK